MRRMKQRGEDEEENRENEGKNKNRIDRKCTACMFSIKTVMTINKWMINWSESVILHTLLTSTVNMPIISTHATSHIK